jgi:hypothetical protein
VDEAVQKGIVRHGRYLILDFDFSRVARLPNMDESVESLRKEINRGLLRFKRAYTEALGELFASRTSNFLEAQSTDNLADLVEAVDHALQGIHDRGEKGNPLWDVKGVCLVRTTIRYNAC